MGNCGAHAETVAGVSEPGRCDGNHGKEEVNHRSGMRDSTGRIVLETALVCSVCTVRVYSIHVWYAITTLNAPAVSCFRNR